MPDPDGSTTADPETVPDTSQHAYKEGRQEDIAGDGEKLQSNDPKDMQTGDLDDGESDEIGPPVHEKA
jgi:hypothetical protein